VRRIRFPFLHKPETLNIKASVTMNQDQKPTILAEVKYISPKRVIVTCEDKTEAILPYWELAWTEDERRKIYNDLYHGYILEVITVPKLSMDINDKIVSVKRFKYDFWNSDITYDKDKGVIIQVDAITPFRAYGRVYWDTYIENYEKTIELSGYFNFRELDNHINIIDIERRWRKHSHIVVGDYLMGIVKNIDTNREELELSISDYLRKIQNNLQLIFPYKEELDHRKPQNLSLLRNTSQNVLKTVPVYTGQMA